MGHMSVQSYEQSNIKMLIIILIFSSVHPELWCEGCHENLSPTDLGSAR